MSKLTRKRFILDDSWDIGKNESWFSDMAEQGLHLRSIGRLFAIFSKGQPAKTRYRIDVLYNEPSQEQLDIYKDCGWNFVTNNMNFYIFSSLESSNSPELHTDPIEQGFTLTNLDKRYRNLLIIISFLMMGFFGMMYNVIFMNNTPFLSMVEGSFLQQILLSIVMLHTFYTVIRNFATVRKLRKSLLEGKSVNHKQNWRRSRFINGTIYSLIIIIGVYSITIPITAIIRRDSYTIPEAEVDLPVVRLAQIEQSSDLKRDTSINYNGLDWGNRVTYRWSNLAPIQYEVEEHGIIENEMWEDSNGQYSPSVSTNYYQLAFNNMADGLIHDLMDRNIDKYEIDIVIREVASPTFDSIYIAEDGIRKQIFASCENTVTYISYYGNEDSSKIITLLSEILKEYTSNNLNR